MHRYFSNVRSTNPAYHPVTCIAHCLFTTCAQLLVHKEEKEETFALARLEAVEFAALILGDIAV